MKKPSFVARKRFRRRLFLRHRVVSKYFVGVFRNRQHLEKKKTTVNGKRFNKATLYVKSDWSSMFVKKNRRLFKKKKSVRRRFSEIFKKKHRRAFFFRKQHYRRRFKRRRINKFCKYKRKLFGRLA